MRSSVPWARAGRVLVIFIVFCPILFVSKLRSVERNQVVKLLPKDRDIPGWTEKGAMSEFDREGLYGHINGGAEIFLQYGFQHLTVCSYQRTVGNPESEIVLEIYRLATSLEAFGIFSIRRAAEDEASPEISALNWVGASQVNLVKDTYFVNILGFECKPKELEAFAIFIAGKIPGASYYPKTLEQFPQADRIRNSGKFLQGPLAAMGESVLLQADFWGLARKTQGYSMRYRPHNSRLILLEFENLFDERESKIVSLFHEYLEDVKFEKGEIWGVNSIGRVFLFRRAGSQAGLSLGEESLQTARARLDHLLPL